MKWICIAITAIVIGACSRHENPPAAETVATQTQPATSPKQPTVLDDQLKALDKAKAVEAQLQKEKESQDKTIEETEGR